MWAWSSQKWAWPKFARITLLGHRKEMATEIPSSGDTTPEFNAVRKSRGEIETAIVLDDFIHQTHSCGLIPTRNLSRPPLDMVLDEISCDPVNYYSLQYVLVNTTLNVGGRFNKGISNMEETFQRKDLFNYYYVTTLLEKRCCGNTFRSANSMVVFDTLYCSKKIEA